MLQDYEYDREELADLRERLNTLVQCVPIEKFAPYGEGNTNYNLFIDDLVQYEVVNIVEHCEGRVAAIMFAEGETPRVMIFDKE